MAALPPAYEVVDAMILCGIDNNALFQGNTAAARIAADLFNDAHSTCRDKTFEEINSDLKTYSELGRLQGQIRLLPGVRRNLKAYVQ